jgi:hypothetical protein
LPGDQDAARKSADVLAASHLIELFDPGVDTSSLKQSSDDLFRSRRKPPHGPGSGSNEIRFRTAAVVAARLLRDAGKGATEARKMVADRFNREGLWNFQRGAKFTAKTIENWSSKNSYEPQIERGMIAVAKHFVDRTDRKPDQIAEVAIVTAIYFGTLSEKSAKEQGVAADELGAD